MKRTRGFDGSVVLLGYDESMQFEVAQEETAVLIRPTSDLVS